MRWSAAQALAWIIKRVETNVWTPEMGPEMESAGKMLAGAISAGHVRAWGRPTPHALIEQIPSDQFRISGLTLIVRPHGELATSPPHKLSTYKGIRWQDIEFDADEIRRAIPKPPPPSAMEWMLKKAEADDSSSSGKKPTTTDPTTNAASDDGVSSAKAFLSRTTDNHNSGTGLIRILEEPEPPGRTLVSALGAQVLAKVGQRIDNLLCDPQGVPNGKGKRTKLTPAQRHKLKSAVIEAVEHANVWASSRPLPNRVPGRGRPPDNAPFVFIDDLVLAIESAGLKPGLRYVKDLESLPVRLFIELASLLWGSVKAPRRVFQRWQRFRPTLTRQ